MLNFIVESRFLQRPYGDATRAAALTPTGTLDQRGRGRGGGALSVQKPRVSRGTPPPFLLSGVPLRPRRRSRAGQRPGLGGCPGPRTPPPSLESRRTLGECSWPNREGPKDFRVNKTSSCIAR